MALILLALILNMTLVPILGISILFASPFPHLRKSPLIRRPLSEWLIHSYFNAAPAIGEGILRMVEGAVGGELGATPSPLPTYCSVDIDSRDTV